MLELYKLFNYLKSIYKENTKIEGHHPPTIKIKLPHINIKLPHIKDLNIHISIYKSITKNTSPTLWVNAFLETLDATTDSVTVFYYDLDKREMFFPRQINPAYSKDIFKLSKEIEDFYTENSIKLIKDL